MSEKKIPLSACILVAMLALGCAATYETSNYMFPELDYLVYKRKIVEDNDGNVIHFTLLGMNKCIFYLPTKKPYVLVYLLFEMQKKVSPQYRLNFPIDKKARDFFIRTTDGQAYPFEFIVNTPDSPDTWDLSSKQALQLVFSVDGFDPDKNPVFDLILGHPDRLVTSKKDSESQKPVYWIIRKCRAIRRPR